MSEDNSWPVESSSTVPLLRARNALIEWTAHILVVAGLLVGFWLIELLMHWLWKDSERFLFGIIPLHWVFDAADLAILGGFLLYGIFKVLQTYRGNI